MAGAIYKLSKESFVTWRSKSLYTKLPVLKVEPAGSLHFQWAKKGVAPNLRISQGRGPCPQTDPRENPILKIQVQPVRPTTTDQPLMYSESCDITFRTHKKNMVCSTEVSKKWNRQECLGIIPTSRPVFSWNLWHLCKNSYTTWKDSQLSLVYHGPLRFSPTQPLGVNRREKPSWNHGPAVLITSSSGNLQNISAWFSCETIWLGMIVWSLGIQSPNVKWWDWGV